MSDGIFQVIFGEYMRADLERWLASRNCYLSPDMKAQVGGEDQETPVHFAWPKL